MLEEPWLHENCIREMEDGAFNGLWKLEVLQIDNNCLEELREGMFSGLNSLKSINLRFNKLSTIDNETFVGLPRPLEINLMGNNLTCDNGLRRFQKEIDAETILTDRRSLVHTFCDDDAFTDDLYHHEHNDIGCKLTDSIECFQYFISQNLSIYGDS